MQFKNITSDILPKLVCTTLFLVSTPSYSAVPDVDLKVLVISTGTPEQDIGLDLIDDMLDEMGVPYDVLNASHEQLTQDKLITGNKGNYNGIILTDASLYYTGPDNYLSSAFTLEEWKMLHQYEINFNVRESVLSGYPASGPYYKNSYDLDYGMDLDTVESRSSFSTTWQIPSDNKEIFEYVNRQNAFAVSDYSRMAHPANNSDGPSVTPILTDSETGKTLVSTIQYPDGREVLLSTITNAWYLVHSQVLAYEFLNYATQGVFIGSRKVYLAAHVDDLFIASELWDADANATPGDVSYRTTSNDIESIVAANNRLLEENPNLPDFKLDLVFNGGGASIGLPPVELTSSQDTYLHSRNKKYTYGAWSTAYISSSRYLKRRGLFNFDLPDDVNSPTDKATLTLTTKPIRHHSSSQNARGSICLVTQQWTESANWYRRSNHSWWSRYGGAYDRNHCVPYKENNGKITVDVTPLVNQWQSQGKPNFGLIMHAAWGYYNLVQVHTREASNANYRPQLTIEFAAQEEPLTATVLDNKHDFRFLSHTLTHRDMYTSSGATFDVAYEEIDENLKVWQQLDLPGYNNGSQVLVTGNHSGLEDAESSEDTYPLPELTPYPEGLNYELVYAMEALGIKYMASDSSRVNQDVEHFLPGSDIMLLPRYPTSVFYNVTNPVDLTDEYNYVFYERYLENGEDPCTINGAICQPRSYEQILAAEAETTLRHMLTYKSWPHYFHAANLHDYGDGATLQYDWLTAVTDKYNSVLNLPIINLDYFSIGEMSKEKLFAKEANVRGTWNRDNNTVTLISDKPATITITGVVSNDTYGGQYILKTNTDHYSETFTVDRLID
ncbi:hypothetical protein DZ860_00300 [Vibrio sinensis]|uniref:Agd3 CBM87 domain-containing protein n=1 Tax=Vibrio sinensis TaxID=2302434 RepID=A0A3A6QQX7_9VIBR|nr:DNRLRE domain-containing protein [Vibrio sinensis]RJX75165.1 hypothetical protein DZ860_00300 [Vibrio sinensis]